MAQTLLCLEPLSSQAQWGAGVEGPRSDVSSIIFLAESCPAEVCVSEQSQNAGELLVFGFFGL